MKHRYHNASKFTLIFIMSLAVATGPLHEIYAEEIVIDSVVASVNGEPITLRDIESRLGRASQVSMSQLRNSGDARFVLDQLIQEQLVRAEAEQRQVEVTQLEVDRYINEVMSRHNLSEEGLKEALAREDRTIDEYRAQIEMDILQTKLASAIFRGGVTVSDQEVESFLAENPTFHRNDSKIKLRQIFISTQQRSDTEAQEILDNLKQELGSGSSFERLAREHSESFEAEDGGLLGILSEVDLSSEIFDAVFPLNKGESSEIVRSATGYHLFYVEDRIAGKAQQQKEQLVEEARTILENQKLQSRMQSYFSTELFEIHTIEKKV